MHINNISIRNYKGYLHTDPLHLKPGFNVLTGKNNAGKTAFIEAASLLFDSKPHINAAIKPKEYTNLDGCSSVQMEFSVPPSEFLEVLYSQKTEFLLPKPSDGILGGERIMLALVRAIIY